MNSPDRGIFEDFYASRPPWDIDGPQPELVRIAGTVDGSLLDAGCGTGENALHFAALGANVTAIDFVEAPIEMARRKAADRGLAVNFRVHDALDLETLGDTFDTVIDSGLFHVFDDEDRSRYVDGLAAVLNPGGRLFLLCFADDEPAGQGPRRVSRAELEQAFAPPTWAIETIEPIRFAVRPDVHGMTFSPGGPRAWAVSICRQSSTG